MDPKRWKRVEEVCHAAIVRAEGERAAFLDLACSGDDALRREVESLLAQGTAKQVSGGTGRRGGSGHGD